MRTRTRYRSHGAGTGAMEQVQEPWSMVQEPWSMVQGPRGMVQGPRGMVQGVPRVHKGRVPWEHHGRVHTGA